MSEILSGIFWAIIILCLTVGFVWILNDSGFKGWIVSLAGASSVGGLSILWDKYINKAQI